MISERRPPWAVRLQTEREALSWNKREMARRLLRAAGYEHGSIDSLTRQIRDWEAGRHFPRDWSTAYAKAFDITEDELFPLKNPTGATGTTALELATAGSSSMKPDQGQRIIQALDVIENDHLGGAADSLSELVNHYALTLCALPPGDVYDELLTVRSYASRVLDRAAAAPRHPDLALTTGRLSHLLAVAACDMGEHAAARVWCSDAERRSQDVRYPELAAWAVLTRALIAFYQGQPHQSVSLATQGQQIASIGTAIHAKLAAQEMRAAAMVGDASHVARARRHAATAIEQLPSDVAGTGVFSIALADDPPYTATSLLLVGRFHEAVFATNRVIRTVYQPEARQRGEHPSGYARSLLILGLAQAGIGRLDESVAAGQAALSGNRPAWPTMVLAGKLDRVLTRDFADTRQAADYHARYLEAKSLTTEHRLQSPGPS